MSTHQDKSLETFKTEMHGILGDAYKGYRLADEPKVYPFASTEYAITAAAQKYADEQYVVAEIKTLESYVDLYARANPPLTVEAIRTQLKGHIEMAKQALAALRKGAS